MACLHARADADCDGCLERHELEPLARDVRMLGSGLVTAGRSRPLPDCVDSVAAGYESSMCMTAEAVRDLASCLVDGLRL